MKPDRSCMKPSGAAMETLQNPVEALLKSPIVPHGAQKILKRALRRPRVRVVPTRPEGLRGYGCSFLRKEDLRFKGFRAKGTLHTHNPLPSKILKNPESHEPYIL